MTLPADVTATLDELSAALRDGAGANLRALVLYGGLARGRYTPGASDINIAVILGDASAKELEKIAKPLHASWRAMRVDPFIIESGELPRLAIAFPTKFLDIQRRHIALFGDDPFTAIVVPREAIRQRVEQELYNLALRMRRRFVDTLDDPVALAATAGDAAASLAVNLRALLLLRGIVSETFEPTLAIYERAAQEFGLDGEALAAVKRLGHAGSSETLNRDLYGRLLATISRAAATAAAIAA